jgi:hypothetical protein
MTMIYETTLRILRRVAEGFKSKYVGEEVFVTSTYGFPLLASLDCEDCERLLCP